MAYVWLTAPESVLVPLSPASALPVLQSQGANMKKLCHRYLLSHRNYTHTYTYVYIYISMYVCRYLYTYRIRTYIHIYICIYVHSCKGAYVARPRCFSVILRGPRDVELSAQSLETGEAPYPKALRVQVL